MTTHSASVVERPAQDDVDSDEVELLDLCRAGDRQALAELWRRHAPHAVRFARSLGPSQPDPEDVVGEAFVRIMRALERGGGPHARFRSYLFRTVKNTRLTMLGRMPATAPIHELESLVSTVGTVDHERMSDSAAIIAAFRGLSERWQQALWLSEIERMPPREAAVILGVSANSVAALAYRARGALRTAWVRAQLRDSPSVGTHDEIVVVLSAYIRAEMSAQERSRVESHLETCGYCDATVSALVRLPI